MDAINYHYSDENTDRYFPLAQTSTNSTILPRIGATFSCSNMPCPNVNEPKDGLNGILGPAQRTVFHQFYAFFVRFTSTLSQFCLCPVCPIQRFSLSIFFGLENIVSESGGCCWLALSMRRGYNNKRSEEVR